MKVAIVRGRNLNKWEMQNYEPLSNDFDLTGYTTRKHVFPHNIISFSIKKLFCLKEICLPLPVSIGKIIFRLLGGLNYMFSLEKELRNMDIIHAAETYNLYTSQALNLKRKHPEKKVVITVWENIPYLKEDCPRQKALKNRAYREADHFLAITERAKQALTVEGAPAHKISVLPMGINLNVFKPKPKDPSLLSKFNLSPSDFVILSVGRMIWKKGYHTVLFAAKKLLSDRDLKHLKFKFLFAGKGPMAKTLKNLAKKMGISDKVIFSPFISYDQIPNIHNLADIFVLPSISEPGWQEQFGMVLIESMASAKPVISTLSGSIPEVIGDAGILVQPDDMLSLYSATRQLALDEELRKKLGEKARLRVENHFDAAKVAKKIKEIYLKIG
jgi:glycosyltransferase involved in cell wall biosynthesis